MTYRSLLLFAFAALLVYAGFCAYLYTCQRQMLYFPQPRQISSAPSMVLKRPDADILVTVRENGGPDAILYFGGNAEDVSINLPDFSERFPKSALYLMHYRGYGGSTGKPSETAIIGDALALYDSIAEKHANIAVVGRSLGTGVAVRVAAERKVARVLLITPYDSIENIAAHAFPWVPVRLMLKDRFESWRHAPAITAPTLLLMASDDEVIPANSTERLYETFEKGRARLLVVPETRHNSIAYSAIYLDVLTRFLRGQPLESL